jgi:asparagine synthase (glutamine-hydrolysing)
MCGIAGLLDTQGRAGGEELAQLARRMAARLRHRGPDADGDWCDPAAGVAFAHRRLSIQDLSIQGAQPMRSAGGRYWLVFNGEIYNFHELRKALEAGGIAFRGHSDTEVLLAAIEQWGLETALVRAVGMFALGLWDCGTRKLSLVRDRLGEKPLYYGWLGGRFAFASELTAIELLPGAQMQIDRGAIAMLLRYGYIPAPQTIYRGVHKLPPGCLLEVRSDGAGGNDFSPDPDDPAARFKPRRYWSVLEVAAAGQRAPIDSAEAALGEFDELLRASVRGQLIADVPVAAFLSSGVDSSAVVAAIQSVSSTPVHTFTVGFEQRRFDETATARRIAAHLGTDHVELFITDREALACVPQIAEIYDEPFADASQVPTCLLSRLVKRHASVCLTGDGGDELFGGYNRYWWSQRLWRWIGRCPLGLRSAIGGAIESMPAGVLEGLFRVLEPALPGSARGSQVARSDKVYKFARMLRARELTEMYRGLNSYWPDTGPITRYATEPADHIRPERMVSSGDVADMLLWDQSGYLPDDNLVKVDRASMAVSLETRVPLLDHRIVEFSWRVPLAMKHRDGESKWLLRRLLYRRVPEVLFKGPKMGFSPPIGDWLREGLRDWAEELLSPSRLQASGVFDGALTRAVWREHLEGRRNRHLQLWPVLMFQAWHALRKSGPCTGP